MDVDRFGGCTDDGLITARKGEDEMRRFGQILVVAAVATLALGAWQATGYAKAKPGTVNFAGGKKGKVTFDHKKHSADIKCKSCHHKEPDTRCNTCHKAKKGENISAKDAFHKSCKACHKKEKKGPTKCKACHKK